MHGIYTDGLQSVQFFHHSLTQRDGILIAQQPVTTLIPDAGVLSGDFRVDGFSSVAYTRLIPAGILIIVALLILLNIPRCQPSAADNETGKDDGRCWKDCCDSAS